MSSNWYKLVMKATKVKYGKGLLLKGVPVIFNKKGAEAGRTLQQNDNRYACSRSIYQDR